MTTDWKALCTELAKVLAEEYGVQREFDSGDPLLGSGAIELLSRARTALSQPEPEGPTEEEIDDLFWKHSSEIGPSLGVGLAHEDAPALICEALARWGRSTIKPDPEGPTVMEIIELADEIETEGLGQVDLVRRALARWGRPAVESEELLNERLSGRGNLDAKGNCWIHDDPDPFDQGLRTWLRSSPAGASACLE